LRHPSLTCVCLAFALCCGTAGAATYEERVIVQLRAMGYTDITISFTLLGRAQILAIGEQDTREIVLNPRTGEILRDFARGNSTGDEEPVAVAVEPIVLGPEPVVDLEAVTEAPVEDVGPATVADTVVDPAPNVTGIVDFGNFDTGHPGSEVSDLSTDPASTASTSVDGSGTDSFDSGVTTDHEGSP